MIFRHHPANRPARPCLRAGAAALVAFGLTAVAARAGKPQPTTLDWARFHLKLDNSAFNDQETSLNRHTLKKLSLAWSFHASSTIYCSPVVASGRVIFGDAHGNLWVLDQATGAVLDQLALGSNAYGSGAYATPTVEGDFMYYQDAHGNLVKYDMATRTEAWRVTAPANDAGFSGPAVYGGRVFAGLSNGTGDNPCTVGKMQAFDSGTGALVWSWDAVPSPYVGGGIWNSPAVDTVRGLVIFATGNPANGSAACGADMPANTPGDYTNSMIALDITNGQLVWQFQAIPNDFQDLDFGGSGAVLFSDGTRDLAGAGSKNGVFYAVDRATGMLAWSADLRSDCSGGCGGLFSPAGAAYGKVFLNAGTSSNSAAEALDAATGQHAWSVQGPSTQFGGPAEANGMVFMGYGTSLGIFRESDGVLLGQYPTASAVWTSPAVVNGRIYFGDNAGIFYVLKTGH